MKKTDMCSPENTYKDRSGDINQKCIDNMINAWIIKKKKKTWSMHDSHKLWF